MGHADTMARREGRRWQFPREQVTLQERSLVWSSSSGRGGALAFNRGAATSVGPRYLGFKF